MSDSLDSAQQSRRKFLEKAGKLAVYTPPVIMLLSYPGTEAIASGGGGEYPPKRPPKQPPKQPPKWPPRPNYPT